MNNYLIKTFAGSTGEIVSAPSARHAMGKWELKHIDADVYMPPKIVTKYMYVVEPYDTRFARLIVTIDEVQR